MKYTTYFLSAGIFAYGLISTTGIIAKQQLHDTDFIDELALIATREGWNNTKLEAIMKKHIARDEARIKSLDEEKESKSGFLGTLSKSTIWAEEQAARVDKKLHERALHTIKLASVNKNLQRQLLRTFKEITALHAEIKELEDKYNRSPKSGVLRGKLAVKKALFKGYLEA